MPLCAALKWNLKRSHVFVVFSMRHLFTASDFKSPCMRDGIIGPAENIGFGGTILPFDCEGTPSSIWTKMDSIAVGGFHCVRMSWTFCSSSCSVSRPYTLWRCVSRARHVTLPKPVTGLRLAVRKFAGTAAMMRLQRRASSLCHTTNYASMALCCLLSSAISASVALSLWVGKERGLKATPPMLRTL
jgi:hypothetical protein